MSCALQRNYALPFNVITMQDASCYGEEEVLPIVEAFCNSDVVQKKSR